MQLIYSSFRPALVAGLFGFLMLAHTPDVIAESAAWTPPAPAEDEFDWIQLTSGEWLKGEIRGMHEEKLEFDSDKLNLLTISWDDVAMIRSKEPMTVNVGSNAVYSGTIRMSEETLTLEGEEAVVELEQASVVGIARARETEWDRWDGKLSAGGTFQSGNTEETTYSVLANATRRTAMTRLGMSYLGRYTESDGIETANSHDANAYFDYFFSRRIFLRTLDLRYLRDPFSNIQHQLNGHTAIGYEVVDRSNLEINVYTGPGFRATRFETVLAGERKEEISPVLAFGGSSSQTVTSWLKWKNDYAASLGDEDSGSYTHRLLSTLSFDIYDPVNLDLSLIWDYTLKPTRRSDGTLPDSTDLQLLIGVGVEF